MAGSSFGKTTKSTKLTQAFIKKAADLVAQGNYDAVVASSMGVHRSTWSGWMKDGEALALKEVTDDPRAQLYLAVREAEAKAEIDRVKTVKDGSENDPRLATWWLERKAPDRWARREEVKIDAKFEFIADKQSKLAGLLNDDRDVIDVEGYLQPEPPASDKAGALPESEAVRGHGGKGRTSRSHDEDEDGSETA